MKKLFICISLGILILFPVRLFSQHILESSRNMYRTGDFIIKQQVDYKDPGRSGEQVLWDFHVLRTRTLKIIAKDSRPITPSTDDFAYDKNGRMIKDLDRSIVLIRYKINNNYPLNLPNTIQFKNGNQIRNSYDAMGVKHKTEYASVISPIVVPVGQSVSTSGSNYIRTGTVYGKVCQTTDYFDK